MQVISFHPPNNPRSYIQLRFHFTGETLREGVRMPTYPGLCPTDLKDYQTCTTHVPGPELGGWTP